MRGLPGGGLWVHLRAQGVSGLERARCWQEGCWLIAPRPHPGGAEGLLPPMSTLPWAPVCWPQSQSQVCVVVKHTSRAACRAAALPWTAVLGSVPRRHCPPPKPQPPAGPCDPASSRQLV